ncbi:MAG: DUF2924 domain-containing protein [Hydrogenophaga sp.]|uniref:DUF2924 domain-containing protein n=1 Tax=Hydrogenophaga sp. TaxID=1904254 RepID=UPI001D9E42C6|nr:DUF2924 domain-containing protein [Hydrogenophaga sp.]MBX3609186.1 DUF2924 domain-containing protein [Hydrogenophaga sp.]
MSVLDEILTAERDVLVSRWKTAFDRDPPPRVHTSLLRRVLAWQAQVESSGLKALLPRPAQPKPSSAAYGLCPGTRLLREWQGATYEVLVLPQGFEYAGKTFTSLTAIARTITGTPWSGPAFFGVKR